MWSDYLAWGRENPDDRQVMHLLLEAGLASEAAQSCADGLAEPVSAWLGDAFAEGSIRGPSVEFVGKLILLQLDLVVTQHLEGEAEALAFNMLCDSLGIQE